MSASSEGRTAVLVSSTTRSSEPEESDRSRALTKRQHANKHQQYLDSLPCPSVAERQSIADIQIRKERDIARKYDTDAEHAAASKIQRTYRGHRSRRQLQGLTLEPSARWTELVKELRFRAAVAQSKDDVVKTRANRAASINAKDHWNRLVNIAGHASEGDRPSLDMQSSPTSDQTVRHWWKRRKHQADNSMLMDLRYFLEMVDEKHRYGANLQIYHEEWQRSDTRQNFFQWLDHGDGRFIDHPYCNREKLMRERIRYLSREERKDYLVSIDEHGRLCWEKDGKLISTDNSTYRDSISGIVLKDSKTPSFDDPMHEATISDRGKLNRKLAEMRDAALDRLAGLTSSNHETHDEGSDAGSSNSSSIADPDEAVLHQGVTIDATPKKHFHVSPATILNKLLRKSVRPGTWIYVTDTAGRLYVGIKSSGAFQHASFLAGARVSSAGSIGIEDGQLVYLSPLSGHYRPTTRSFHRFIDNLKTQGVDLSKVRVSQAYQILLGMEYYAAVRKGVKRIGHRREKRPSSASSDRNAVITKEGAGRRSSLLGTDGHEDEKDEVDSANPRTEEPWEEDRRRLARLMEDLNMRHDPSEE